MDIKNSPTKQNSIEIFIIDRCIVTIVPILKYRYDIIDKTIRFQGSVYLKVFWGKKNEGLV